LVRDAIAQTPARGADDLRLFTLRSDSQFNTTIYSHDDHFRGIRGSRMVLLMNERDIERRGLAAGADVVLETRSTDTRTRRVAGLKIVAFDLPEGCVAGYYPECNPLLPLSHHAKQSKVPAAKSIPVRIVV
jgi:formate dehydrogenase major subunit